MKLYTINTGYFKLDGGAMFGVVPKSIWKELNPPDENNMCTWAMRCLLIDTGDRRILIDNGIGDKQDAKFFSHYYLHGNDSLKKSLNTLGYTEADITDVFLTHLHFDHCGGSVFYNSPSEKFELTFPNATYWSNQDHWNWAVNPNAREKASFLKENILPIQASGQLKLINENETLHPDIRVHFFSGHTEHMMVPEINFQGKKVFYCADLLPSVHHIPIPYVMAYDTRPLLSLVEKKSFLEMVHQSNGILFFEHDPLIECARVVQTEKGIRVQEKFRLSEI